MLVIYFLTLNVHLSYILANWLILQCINNAFSLLPSLLYILTVCAVIKDLREIAVPFVGHVVRHYTLVAVAQQAGPFPFTTKLHKLYSNAGTYVCKAGLN